MFRPKKIALAVAGVLAVASAAAQAAGPTPGPTPGTYVGPSSSQTPHVEPTADGWEVVSLITVGDSPKSGAYPMVGIPDGLGAVAGKFSPRTGDYIADRAYMTVFMNHEIRPGQGAVRAHGQKGAFVSQWTVHLDSLTVTRGEDLITKVMTWDPVNHAFVDTTGTTAFNRFCSADLPGKTAFYNPRSRKGYHDLIFMNGEEAGTEGRAFAHIVSGPDKGTAYELPYLGKFSWENAVAHPGAGDKTIVVGLDDSTPGQVYVYVGEKRKTGNPMEKAGLQGGKLYGVKVAGAPFETGVLGGSFSLEDVSDLALGTGAELQNQSRARLVTEFARPEDGHWDTKNAKVFYFVTSGATNALLGGTQTARLYKLTFDSLSNPTGGTIELVVDSASLVGTDGEKARSFDNITVDEDGQVLIQEDPGASAYIAKTWRVDPASPLAAVQIFESDRDRFLAPTPPFSVDEESSGIIEITDIVRGARWAEPHRRYYLGDMEAHYPTTPELVQDGQLYLLASPAMEGKRRWGDHDDDHRGHDHDRDD